MKILHIATDDKFVDHALPVFEKVYPEANDVFVFASKKPLKYVELNPDHIETKQSNYFNKKPKLGKEAYQKYDLVIFHCLRCSTYPELANIPEDTPTIWLGWGVDYYVDFLHGIPLLLSDTQKIYNRLVGNKPKRQAAKLVKRLVGVLRPRSIKIRAVERITIFSPVLPEEFGMVKNARTWRRFPEFASWNYGTLEDHLIKGFEGESVTGKAILIGNSATYTGNHAEVFSLLRELQVNDRQVIAPLSYGDPKLAAILNAMGQTYFADNFEPLMDFMPIEDYIAIIKKCGYVIMNHVRQQAVGNIVIMLYLGARVFLRQENPAYNFFRKSGITISTVQELVENPELLNEPLTQIEQAKNKAIVSDYWSRERAYERTRMLVEKAFAMKGLECPEVLPETYR
ncbi:TDP-N-acetylfucosamine:lipid II N-acetylfucosaminyltransferase [Marinobacter manganoxydans]|uniref:4-alpha-L-fucosyltransferase n=1 Tax=Marinobacter manganoxydans MnI7-9 TaxID=1094979 RepID=G6YP55_9GAMM|nr:TDP-N-acetylfucosamine:lipid II N-acetylfucosaminyltransferase [Marinobacter manganoxydans]EHJ06117.1 hypothetical protein KYE_03085 [Marinobacter manganoxydans MnI7-9]